jgi:signal transduction histidine kinase
MSFLNLAGRGEEAPLGPESERRIEKLIKINGALMRRVERSMGHAENAFSLFQTAIALDGEVKARTSELKTTVEQLERSNVELTAARDVAERANRTKTGFFTSVGHDLLQPLQAARLTLSALAELEDGDDRKALVFQVEQALSAVEDLLRTILDLSRLEAGALRPSMQPVDVEEVFKSVVLGLLPMARAKGISLRFRAANLWAISDPLMLRRVIQNLAANAVRYTDVGGVLVGARRDGDSVNIGVWDTGPGISVDEQERIFGEFERGAASRRTGSVGLGLGLSIVRRMAEALGHDVRLRSIEGRGSCFWVRAKQASPTARISALAMSTLVSSADMSARVLVIENDNSVSTAMTALLRQWGCEARVVRTIIEASAVISEDHPDIVLADYHLDNGDCGLTAIGLLRATCGDNLPAVVITADRTSGVREAVEAAGCELMLKPVRPAEMRAVIAHLLPR